MQKLKRVLKRFLQFLANPRLLLCFGIAWIITNGWSYIMLGLGFLFDSIWMEAVAGAYLTFLWLPISPEHIITVLITLGLMKLLFPKDEKTLGLIRDVFKKLKAKFRRKAKKKKPKGDKGDDG